MGAGDARGVEKEGVCTMTFVTFGIKLRGRQG